MVKINSVATKKILDMHRAGYPIDAAGFVAGVSEQDAREWLARGDSDDEGEYHEFVMEYRKIEAEIAAQWLKKVEEGGENWKIYAELLERRFWRDYGDMEIFGPPEARYPAAG